ALVGLREHREEPREALLAFPAAQRLVPARHVARPVDDEAARRVEERAHPAGVPVVDGRAIKTRETAGLDGVIREGHEAPLQQSMRKDRPMRSLSAGHIAWSVAGNERI